MTHRPFHRVAIVNRGEPAMRFLRGAREYSRATGHALEVVAVYTTPDADSPYVRYSDDGIDLGAAQQPDENGTMVSAYVMHDRVIQMLKDAEIDAVWPGWGFVSEDARFVAKLEEADIVFLGPSSDAINALGDKLASKYLADTAGVPMAKWAEVPLDMDDAALMALGEEIGFPLMVKASAGGGGRGIRMVMEAKDLADAVAGVRYEVDRIFGSGGVFLERCVTGARHIEVQLVVGVDGTAHTLGVRDCSLQRRSQKVIEEASSPILPPADEKILRDSAARLAEAAGYRGVGTAEFLYDPKTRDAAFLEVNSRLQVEHTVTECIFGCDLVHAQIDIAMGKPWSPPEGPPRGWAIEARLNAENPERGFAPAPGRIKAYRPPSGPGIRVDSGVEEGITIAPDFDSMIAKVIAWAPTRELAIARITRALREFEVLVEDGTTNKAFMLEILGSKEFIDGTADTRWLDRAVAAGELAKPDRSVPALLLAAVVNYRAEHVERAQKFFRQVRLGVPQDVAGPGGQEIELKLRGEKVKLMVHAIGDRRYLISSGDGEYLVHVQKAGPNAFLLRMNGQKYRALVDHGRSGVSIEIDGVMHHVERSSGGVIAAPAPALVANVAVQVGDIIKPGDPVCTVEAMKMETVLFAEESGTVEKVLCRANQQVQPGQPLVVLAVDSEDAAGVATLPEPPKNDLADVTESAPEAVANVVTSLFLGYELPTEMMSQVEATLNTVGSEGASNAPAWAPLVQALRSFVDIERLFDRALLMGTSETVAQSAEMAFFDYCRDYTVDAEASPIIDRIGAAMAWYGVPSLENGTLLRNGLWRAASAARHPADRYRLAGDVLRAIIRLHDGGLEPQGLRSMLQQIALLSGTRYPAVADLARQATYAIFQRPRYLTGRSDAVAAVEALSAGSAQALETVRTTTYDVIEALVGRAVVDPGAALAGLVTRLYPTCSIEDASIDGAVGRFETDKGVVVAAVGHPDAASELIRAAAARVNDGEVVTFQLIWTASPDVTPTLPALADGSAAVETWWDGRLRHRTRLSRDGWHAARQGEVHPAVYRRLSLERFDAFKLEKLPAAEHIHAFLATARDNPKDERVLLFAEVFEAPASIDDDTAATALLSFEQQWFEGLRVLRQVQSGRGRRRRLQWNQLTVMIRQPVATSAKSLARMAHRLEPHTRGLGIESVVVEVQGTDGEPYAFSVRRPGKHRLEVIPGKPDRTPLKPVDDYASRMVRCRRLNVPYPYEVARLLCGDANDGRLPHPDLVGGSFQELDLDASGALVPVERAPGGNSAGVVVGIVTNVTAKYPEGMRRVWIASDPTRAMGALAEPECRRICAALDLAAESGMPVEWIAISAGAKIAMDSGTENLDWTARVLRRIVRFTQAGGAIHVIVPAVNVGAQSYWNAEATMLMHTKGLLIMTPEGSMVLTGKRALEISGGVAAEDEKGIGGFERIMGPNGQAQYFAQDLGDAYRILLNHYEVSYRMAGEARPRKRQSEDPVNRDVCDAEYTGPVDDGFAKIGEIFDLETNQGRKRPFSIRALMSAVKDRDAGHLERFQTMREAETAVVWDTHVGGHAISMIGIESRPVMRSGRIPLDGPDTWAGGTLFPQSSRKVARALNAASGERPVVVLANLSGFDGSPESLRRLQLEYGAEIGRAVVNFDGPIIFVVVGRYHGGAYVVFSRALNPNLVSMAVEGSFASVIGGAPAAAVVFPREVRKMVAADPRIQAMEAKVRAAPSKQRAEMRQELEDLREEVMLEKRGEVAATFDGIHNVQRAVDVGSLDKVITAKQLRPAIIEQLGN